MSFMGLGERPAKANIFCLSKLGHEEMKRRRSNIREDPFDGEMHRAAERAIETVQVSTDKICLNN